MRTTSVSIPVCLPARLNLGERGDISLVGVPLLSYKLRKHMSKPDRLLEKDEESDEIIEDIESMGSKDLKKRVREARQELSNEKAVISLEEVAKSYIN